MARRHAVNKSRSARRFRRDQARTKAINIRNPPRGGIRL